MDPARAGRGCNQAQSGQMLGLAFVCGGGCCEAMMYRAGCGGSHSGGCSLSSPGLWEAAGPQEALICVASEGKGLACGPGG